ncbi:hypothetical protein [Rhodococcus aetherivorans]|uniref:hypothetical protein n=1 Tax=Rhodococcus aetherivorans TaxID=191292 RepID=UPI0038901409
MQDQTVPDTHGTKEVVDSAARLAIATASAFRNRTTPNPASDFDQGRSAGAAALAPGGNDPVATGAASAHDHRGRFDRRITGYRSGDWDTKRGRLNWSFFGEDQFLTMHFHHAEPVTTRPVEEIKRLLYFGIRKVTQHLGIVGILPDDYGYTFWVDPHVPIGESKRERQVVLLRQKDDFLEDPSRGQVKFVLLTVDFDVTSHDSSPSAGVVGAHSVGEKPVVEAAHNASTTDTTPPWWGWYTRFDIHAEPPRRSRTHVLVLLSALAGGAATYAGMRAVDYLQFGV